MENRIYLSDNSICTYCALHYADNQKDRRRCLLCVDYDEFIGIECEMITEDQEYEEEGDEL